MTGGNATARFVVVWPQSRTIPGGTNRIIVYVNGPQIAGSIAYVVDNAGFGQTTTVTVDIPAGPKRLFSVEARKVASVQYSQSQRVPYTSPALTEGEFMGAGQDGQAYDIGVGESINATVEIKEAGTPGSGVVDVRVAVNQILTDRFPAVLVLQIIRDQDGNPITNLNKGNFELLEDGNPAVITDVRTVLQARSEISVALVLDRSGSMDGQPNTDLETAASTFVDLMQPGDSAEVINFSSNVEVTQPFTSDKSLLNQAIVGHFIGSLTALYDAVYQAVADTAQRTGRRSVIAMTDGQDNDSSKTSADCVALAQSGGVPVFTIGLGGVDETALRGLAENTGGLFTVTSTSAELQRLYELISKQLESQIQISFISPDPQPRGKVRHVEVRFRYGTLTGESTYDYTY